MLVMSPTRSVLDAMHVWVSTRQMVVSAWTVSQDMSRQASLVPLAAHTVVSSGSCTFPTRAVSVGLAQWASSPTKVGMRVMSVEKASELASAVVRDAGGSDEDANV